MSASEAAPTTGSAAVLDTTVPQLVARNAREHPDLPALTDSPDGHSRTWTWSQAFSEAQVLAAGLTELGLHPGQMLLIMMANRAEHWLVDQAATQLGAVPSTVYATLSPDQVTFIARHSRARVVVLEGAEQVRRWSGALRELPDLEHVVVLNDTTPLDEDPRFLSWTTLRRLGEQKLRDDPGLVDRYAAEITPTRAVTVLYTSGTTGDPKGVVLTHHNVVYAASVLEELTGIPHHAPTICYLPLAHVAERMTGIYAPIHNAAHVHFCSDPTQVAASLASVRPTSFFGVPRVWEKLATAVRALPPDHRATTEERQRLRERIGLDRAMWPSSGAAPIGKDVLEFFSSLGVDIIEVWGMTETTGCATTNLPGDVRVGSVGRAVPGVEVRTADDGEVLVRGPIVCAGYLQPDGAIRSATDEDGWLHTGDVGTLEDGFLTITDRKKELIITAAGKNIAPTAVENVLKAHPLIGHALAFGDRQPYVVALLVLDEDAAPAWARARGIEFDDLDALAAHPQVRSEVDKALEAANAKLSRAEQVKRYLLLGRRWSPEGGELTPTLKLKRRIIHDRYSREIDELYT
jgi:long-chain acyl-CoA synthetase